jgi:hypothetical protein
MIKPVLVEIKVSKMLPSEVGLFAVEDLETGTIIANANQYDAEFYSWNVLDKLTPATQQKIKGFCLGTEKGFYCPDNLNYLSIVWYMNHSCEPNVAFNETEDFVTIKPVKKNEELCWDYGYGETNPNFKMTCLCGKPSCRGIITGNDWKNPKLKEKFSKYFLPTLRS